MRRTQGPQTQRSLAKALHNAEYLKRQEMKKMMFDALGRPVGAPNGMPQQMSEEQARQMLLQQVTTNELWGTCRSLLPALATAHPSWGKDELVEEAWGIAKRYFQQIGFTYNEPPKGPQGEPQEAAQ